jgi:anti-sigma B factor antagonist
MELAAEHLDDGVLKLSLAGRMDARGASEIDVQFAGYAARQKAVVVDMSAVSFLASIGIRTLLLTANAMLNNGGKMVLLNPSENATHILKLTSTDMQIPIVGSLEEARLIFAN